MRKALYIAAVILGLAPFAEAGSNLLRNVSFELPISPVQIADFWTYDAPPGNTNGGSWGATARRNWRARTGDWMGAIQGTWFNGQNFGGYWQQNDATNPVLPGVLYEASAWFWADDSPGIKWTCAVQRLSIEFYDTNFVVLATGSTNFTGQVSSNWIRHSVRYTAPAGAFKARLVVSVEGAGGSGALQMDDAELRTVTDRTQDFNDWTTFTNENRWVRDDWIVSTGRAEQAYIFTSPASFTVQVARTGSAIGLPRTNGVVSTEGVSIRSAFLSEGIGTIRFWYRHGSLEEDETAATALVLRVQASANGTTWSTIASVTNIRISEYREFNQFFNDSASKYIRLLRTDNDTNRLYIDDISIDLPQPVPRVMDFVTWPTNNTANGAHTYLSWSVITGRVTTALALADQSAVLPGGGTNAVISPLFSNGYGTIRFQYRRGTNGFGPVTWRLEESPDGNAWTAIAGASNITGTGYTPFEQFFYQPNARYIRIANVSTSSADGSTLLIDEGFSGGAIAPSGWTFTNIGFYSSSGNFGVATPSLRFDTSSSRITTPALAPAPTNIIFWTRGQSIAGSTLTIVGNTPSGAVTVAIVSNITGTATTNRFAVNNSGITNLFFSYTKVSGNLAFDDLRVQGGSSLGAQPAQDLAIDDIFIDEARISRQQNFNAFPAGSGYVTLMQQGWIVSNVIIETANAFEGQAARLRNGVNSYVQSPSFPDGVGPISFQYRLWSNDAAANIQVQLSTNGTTWTTQAVVNVANTNYAQFSQYVFITNAAAVRILNPTGSRVYIDFIDISEPQPPADLILSGYTVPPAPFTNDAVFLWANALPAYGATGAAVTAYYRIGTNGAFTSVPMTRQDLLNFRATNAIAAQPSGTIVQYYYQATFGGPAAASNLPKFFPPAGSNGPAFYAIARAPKGGAWINEVNLVLAFGDDQGTEYLELAGPAGFNIGGWRVEILDAGDSTNGSLRMISRYVIPASTPLPADTPSYGFWLIGNTNVPGRDQTMTNSPNDLITAFVIVRLYNEGGGLEQSLSFGGVMTDSEYTGWSEDFFDPSDSISLTGTGTNYSNFVWTVTVTNNMTAGSANSGQTFPTGITGPPDAWLMSMAFSGANITLIARGNTNNWKVTPHYATNLLAVAPVWTNVPSFSVTTNGPGTNVVTFAAPGTNAVYLYRLFYDGNP